VRRCHRRALHGDCTTAHIGAHCDAGGDAGGDAGDGGGVATACGGAAIDRPTDRMTG